MENLVENLWIKAYLITLESTKESQIATKTSADMAVVYFKEAFPDVETSFKYTKQDVMEYYKNNKGLV